MLPTCSNTFPTCFQHWQVQWFLNTGHWVGQRWHACQAGVSRVGAGGHRARGRCQCKGKQYRNARHYGSVNCYNNLLVWQSLYDSALNLSVREWKLKTRNEKRETRNGKQRETRFQALSAWTFLNSFQLALLQVHWKQSFTNCNHVMAFNYARVHIVKTKSVESAESMFILLYFCINLE